MGYYTKYSLHVEHYGSDKTGAKEMIEKVMSVEIPNDYGTIGDLVEGGMDSKWYDHEKDMRAISETFPYILFTLEGIGEEDDDAWKCYFLNGKAQYCKAIRRFPPFDASKLK